VAARIPLPERAGDLLLAAGLTLVPLIPRRLGLRLGELLGRVVFAFDRRHRRVALTQLGACLGGGPGETKRVARRAFENLGRLIIEMFYMARLSPAEVARRVRFEGLDNLWAALAKGRGAIVLTAHFGAFELMPAAFSLAYGRRINIIVRRMDWPPAHRALVRLRERCGNSSIHKGRAMRQVIRLLAAGEMVGVLLDQNVAEREGVFVDFLGRPACTNKGVAMVALRTQTPVVPAFIRYEGRGRHVVVVEPEVELLRSGDGERDVQENTALFTQTVERWVRRYPDHWFWMHRRWKTRPGAEAANGGKEANGGACSQAA
jgi:KDO2-lipid IV(A) lauroyltransferase